MSDKRNVLVLNFSYEPIGTISIRDAFTNYFNDKVYIEEYKENQYYHSINKKWKVPNVIRLKKYIFINKKKGVGITKRSRIYIRDAYRCAYCGIIGKEKDLTLDHLIPRAKKNQYSQEIINSPENLVTSCFKCNQKKKDLTLEESEMELLYTPRRLKVALDTVIIHHWARREPSWKKYLFLSNECDKNYYESRDQ